MDIEVKFSFSRDEVEDEEGFAFQEDKWLAVERDIEFSARSAFESTFPGEELDRVWFVYQ